MIRLLALAIVLVACGTETTSMPDAALPTCPELGCPSGGDALCTREGVCACDGQACQRVGSGF